MFGYVVKNNIYRSGSIAEFITKAVRVPLDLGGHQIVIPIDA